MYEIDWNLPDAHGVVPRQRPGIIHVSWSFTPCLRSTLWPFTPNDMDDTGPCPRPGSEPRARAVVRARPHGVGVTLQLGHLAPRE